MISNIMQVYLKISIVIISFIFLLYSPITQSMELDLTAAEDSVGKRFANKFCEAKEGGSSTEISSEFALNNTYLKFVAFPDDQKFIADLWEFTRNHINQECGTYITEKEESDLRDFFKEEGYIASNRDLYLPK